MSVSSINHVVVAQSRVTQQYRDKPKFMAYVAMLAEAFDDIELCLVNLRLLDDIDAQLYGFYVNTGVNLDVVGEVLGQKRRITDALQRPLFGFADDNTSLPFAEEGGDPDIGGYFWDEDSSATMDALLDDDPYRVALRARKLLDMMRVVSADDVYGVLDIVFPDLANASPIAQVIDLGMMCFAVQLPRLPTQNELAIIRYAKLMPRPAAVRYELSYYDSTAQNFGFSEDPSAYGFGEEGGDPDLGGVMAEEI